MEKSKLQKIFKHHDFIELENHLIFSDLEVFDTRTELSDSYATIDELLAGQIDGVNISDLLDEIEFEFVYSGGRGSTWTGSEMAGGFTNADQRGRKAEDYGKILFPATFNTQGRFATQKKAISMFTETYGDSDTEYGISVDSQGFVHRHIKGGKSSVPIFASGRDHMVVHNHPSGGAFSKADMISTSKDKNASGIVATSKKATYTLRKTKTFDAKGFAKAVNKAKWPKEMSYDQGVDWWLRRNAKTFGYKYNRMGGSKDWIRRGDVQ